MEDQISEALAGLIQKGLVEIVGVNKDGELLYQLAEGVEIPKQ